MTIKLKNGTLNKESSDSQNLGVPQLIDQWFRSNAPGDQSNGWIAPVSMWEQGHRYHLEMELPGIDLNDVEVTFVEGRLMIAAKRQTEPNANERKYFFKERLFGQTERGFTLPDNVNPKSIVAKMRQGILRVEMEKTEQPLPDANDGKTDAHASNK